MSNTSKKSSRGKNTRKSDTTQETTSKTRKKSSRKSSEKGKSGSSQSKKSAEGKRTKNSPAAKKGGDPTKTGGGPAQKGGEPAKKDGESAKNGRAPAQKGGEPKKKAASAKKAPSAKQTQASKKDPSARQAQSAKKDQSPKKKQKETANARITGKLAVTARGFGFVTVDDGPDIFIPLENMGTAMDGDTVTAEIIRQVTGRKPVGKVVKVTRPAVKDLVGVFHRRGRGGEVHPEDERRGRPLEIPPNKLSPRAPEQGAEKEAESGSRDGKKTRAKKGEPAEKQESAGTQRVPRDGEFVLVRRERWEDPRENPVGRIVEIIGSPDDPGIDTLIVAKNNGLRTEFPPEVLKEAEQLSLPPMKKEKKRREDLRETLCFTIDPESAKDYDDAVSLQQREDGIFELGVHIADVSYFVREGSALDREALERGTSAYFVNKVIPMLPEKLSNDLCSLRENEDRLAFSVIMEIDSRGVIRDYRITESIIRSNRRFSYREIEEVIEGAGHPYAQTIHQMMMLSLVLRRAREEQGSIDFDIPVPLISLDENGIPHEVRPSERIDANRMIEEFMLAANLTVARHMLRRNRQAPAKPGGGTASSGAADSSGTADGRSLKNGVSDNSKADSGGADGGSVNGGGSAKSSPADSGAAHAGPEPWPFVYRVHEKPDENEVRDFLDLLGRLGINYRVPGDLEPEDYRKILDLVENLEFKDFAEKVALRSMTKAVYSTENIGHFGLAFDAYTHFTSPIRRYPDLLVHRLLKKYAAKGARPPAGGTKTRLQNMCEQCSDREIRAVEAEREHTKIKAMEFLAGKVGETYEGIIAGITSFGFFVELNYYLIEGLVHVSELRGDRYEFDKDNYTLTGERSGTTYRLGDPVRVTIKKVSVADRKADFVLAEESD
jgi:ribonuclease R